MTFNNPEELLQSGYVGFKTIGELQSDSTMIPNIQGTYLVLKLQNQPADFLQVGTGGYFKRKNPNVTLLELQEKWIEETIVVYIGKATSLKKRLRQYFSFGQGKNIGHYGGRFIWQLKYSSDLIVCWKPLANDNPREIEKDLIKLFVATFGKKPFANLAN